MKCVFRIDGVAYLAQTKREAIKFIKFWSSDAITFTWPTRFETTWRFQHVERAPSFGQLERINFDKVDYS